MKALKKRYLIKLSGEIIKGDKDSGISWEAADKICSRIATIVKSGVELGFVIGGGNIFRGASGDIKNYNRLIGDQIGMMSTVINGLVFCERMQSFGIPAILQSGIKVDGVADLFNREKVEETFSKNGIVVFSGGLGVPFFSTDTTSAVRALQINADCLFKATKVDGIYDKDPVKNPDAKKFINITYNEIIEKELKFMDLTSIILMKENNMKLMVFNALDDNSLENACKDKIVGTLVEK
jgi:uridylate kinase